MEGVLKLDGALLPLVERTLRNAATTRIVDLCSGGAGPLLPLVARLAGRGIDVHATLTDLFPNVGAFERTAAASAGRIEFVADSVDARTVPPRLTGLRTIFNGFHHFKPEDAVAILRGAVKDEQPIAIFEISDRSARNAIPVILVPIFVWIVTPFMRPFRWSRLLWTYPLPLVPLMCFWDGVVSQLRAYTPFELRQMGDAAGRFEWEAGQVPIAGGRGRLTYLIGVPVNAGPQGPSSL